MRPIRLSCESFETTVDPARPSVLGSICLRRSDADPLELVRGFDLEVSDAPHTSRVWKLTDRSPGSARMSADGSPVGIVLRCESIADRVGLDLRLVNTSGTQIRTSASLRWRMSRALTKRNEDPEVVIENTRSDIAWSRSGIKIQLACSGSLGEIQSDHANADTPWFSVGASMPETVIEPGASVSIGAELVLSP